MILMPLFSIRMPANAALFYGFLMQIASFDIVPVQNLYDMMFPDLERTNGYQPYSANFDQLGFSSMYFMYNLGSILLAFLAIPIQIILYFILLPFKKHNWV